MIVLRTVTGSRMITIRDGRKDDDFKIKILTVQDIVRLHKIEVVTTFRQNSIGYIIQVEIERQGINIR